MIGETPGEGRGPLAPEVEAEAGPPVTSVWSVWTAIALVCFAFVLALLAGLFLAAIETLGLTPVARALAVGAVLAGIYVATLGIVWAVSARFGVSVFETVGAARPAGPRWYAIAACSAFVGSLFSMAFTTALTALGVEVPRDDIALFKLMPSGLLGISIMVVLLVVVAPIAEEVVYRGVLLSALENRWGAAAGLFGSTLLFSAAHGSLVGFVPLLVVGGLFGWLFLASRSLRVAVVAHVLFNMLGVAVLLAQGSSGIL